MQIEVRLFASLRDRLPGDDREHRGCGRVELDEGASVQSLLARLEIPARMAPMVLVNGVQIARDPKERARLMLEKDDVVSIFPPVAGG